MTPLQQSLPTTCPFLTAEQLDATAIVLLHHLNLFKDIPLTNGVGSLYVLNHSRRWVSWVDAYGMDIISKYIENVNRDLCERDLHTFQIFGAVDRRAHDITLDIYAISIEEFSPVDELDKRSYASTLFWCQTVDLVNSIRRTFKECL